MTVLPGKRTCGVKITSKVLPLVGVQVPVRVTTTGPDGPETSASTTRFVALTVDAPIGSVKRTVIDELTSTPV